jgi:hypothetical protein
MQKEATVDEAREQGVLGNANPQVLSVLSKSLSNLNFKSRGRRYDSTTLSVDMSSSNGNGSSKKRASMKGASSSKGSSSKPSRLNSLRSAGSSKNVKKKNAICN